MPPRSFEPVSQELWAPDPPTVVPTMDQVATPKEEPPWAPPTARRGRRACICAAVAALTVSSIASAQSPSPFAADGPLAPWSGPLPAVRLSSPAPTATQSGVVSPYNAFPPAPYRADSSPQHAGANQSTGWSLRRGPGASEVEPDRVEPTGDEANVTYVSLIANPALAPWGKTGGRIEVAPLAAHAVFFELSKLSVTVPGTSSTAKGTEFDVGYHLFPFGDGANGLYLGPRYLWASGESEEATGQLHGVGGDIGYQLVIAGCVALNVGIGAAHVSAKAEAKPGYVAQRYQGLGGSAGAAGLDLSLTQSTDFWLPLATLGAGIAL